MLVKNKNHGVTYSAVRLPGTGLPWLLALGIWFPMNIFSSLIMIGSDVAVFNIAFHNLSLVSNIRDSVLRTRTGAVRHLGPFRAPIQPAKCNTRFEELRDFIRVYIAMSKYLQITCVKYCF